MYKYAFEDLKVKRLSLYVDDKNIPSRNAVLKYGATQEGILRSNRMTWKGFYRNTVVYSILDEEWNGIK
jgi:RimJ/RimL family protein N-acetyltransferase